MDATGSFAIRVEAGNSAGKISAILTLTVSTDPPPVLMDAWRRANFGASATDSAIAGDDADPDGDGFTNLQEFHAGTNPLDAASPSAGPAIRRARRQD